MIVRENCPAITTLLVGERIVGACLVYDNKHDDRDVIELTLENGKTVIITASFGGYSRKARDEYPASISVDELVVTPLPVAKVCRTCRHTDADQHKPPCRDCLLNGGNGWEARK